MARERIIKGTPKRGKLTRSQVRRAVKKVFEARLAATEGKSSTTQIPEVTTIIKVGRDAKTGRFISRQEAERRRKTAVIETITIPKIKK